MTELPILRISPSQLETWNCRERWRLSYFTKSTYGPPNIYYAFGSCIHRMAYGYWSGWDYQTAYSYALLPALQDQTKEDWVSKFGADTYTDVVYPHSIESKSSYIDNRKLSAKMLEKWNGRLDNLAKLTSLYFSHHGTACTDTKPLMNEQMIEWDWGVASGYQIRCTGIIDRVLSGTLTDTKTCSAIGRDWRQSVKWDNIRRPQLSFYYRYCEWANIPVEKVEIEALVQPYKGSEPDIAHIDITKELLAGKERSYQQMDWMIREIASFCRDAADSSPWPMNREICTSKYRCQYLDVCDLRAAL